MKIDNIHYDPSELDGYQKTFNLVVSPREAGKTTALLRKAYKLFVENGKSTVILRRRIADITDVYVADLGTVIDKFQPDDNQIKMVYKKGGIKDGVIDVYLYEDKPQGKKIGTGPIFRVVALSAPMSRIKSTILRNVGLMIFDEFICNVRCNEKYLTGEAFIFREIYNTYVRECPGLKVWFLGNAYSLYTPYTAWLKVPTNKLKPGSIVSGPNWAMQCYDLKPELKEQILKNNPLYQFDDTYSRYAFSGEAINDTNILVLPTLPRGFTLRYVFKIEQKYVGYWYGTDDLAPTGWWASIVEWDQKYRRTAWCFDFDNLGEGSMIIGDDSRVMLRPLALAVQQRNISFKDIEASYLTEDIYPLI